MSATNGVLVVGAGPVGLVAASQLARLGVPVRLIDVLEAPTDESRAVVIHARSLEMLAALGVRPQLEARGRRVDRFEIADGRTGATRAAVDLTGIPSRHPSMLDIAQPDTEAVLAERAAELGVVVERGVELTALAQDADGVEVTLRTAAEDETARFGWVVGADGAHSTTRHLVGTHLEGGFHGQHFAMADVEVETSLAPTTGRMFTHPDGVAMLFPLRETRARVIFLVDDPGDAAAPTLEQIEALTEERMAGRVRVTGSHWLTYFEIHHAQVPQYRHGRVLLAGDAAHVHSPAGAQGMNTGIQDAANLAWKLALVARHGADPGLLDSYQEERHPVGAEVVRVTTTLTDVGTASGPLAALRDAAMFVVGHVPALGEAAAERLAELTVGYPHSSLSVRHGAHRHGTAKAGEHAPDPEGLRRADGTPVAVEELLERPGFVLLVHGDDGALGDVLGDLGTVVPLDADDEGMALVRPDGYLGLVADTTDPDVLRRYLADVLRVPAAVTAI
ncbi:2-polyprenyl-6-methoxyphenol hydroxylase-like FAD-dependent oxidoreductase [Actinomycetospora succinea]|uniref:2-polyprenyl-6-methoxyphenol hydroxylase-like FAD-dependent oxidoreductase n=1 Tax=Actinomycetospora succinea TaxID=663603 RepID=A0A4R6UTX6_9PSEU|nr:FAD-dependent monooxygenase [Actinomycetospora succinea]TDQ50808.1 2-polyprenyl-6-methoxyphenol hydroxylase-like FAD-dependent oxidoreductase [Actinomycetospora succinea]